MSLEQRRIECVDSLRISPREETEIISELSQAGTISGAGASSDERRRNGRVPYLNEAGLFVQMKHPGGSVVNYLVRTRNLSPTGIAFLHGSFVYTGTPCVLALHDKDGKMVGVEGKVVRCQLVRGHVHDVGVRFNRALDLNQFVTFGEDAAGTSAPTARIQTSEELPKLGGHVLCAEDNTSDAELLKFYLESLGVNVTAVATGPEAMKCLEGGKFDAVLTTLCLPGMNGGELAKAARAAGFTEPIIALTPDDRYEVKVDALNRGCTDLLAKPFSAEQLVRVLEAHLPRAADSSRPGPVSGPLPSDMWANSKMRPLISKFVGRLSEDVKEIERLAAAKTPSNEALAKLCMALKGSAGSFGYPAISKVAHGMTELLQADAESATEQLAAAVAELAKLSAAAALFLQNQSKLADGAAGSGRERPRGKRSAKA